MALVLSNLEPLIPCLYLVDVIVYNRKFALLRKWSRMPGAFWEHFRHRWVHQSLFSNTTKTIKTWMVVHITSRLTKKEWKSRKYFTQMQLVAVRIFWDKKSIGMQDTTGIFTALHWCSRQRNIYIIFSSKTCVLLWFIDVPAKHIQEKHGNYRDLTESWLIYILPDLWENWTSFGRALSIVPVSWYIKYLSPDFLLHLWKVAFLGNHIRKIWCPLVELVKDDFLEDYTYHREERHQARTYIEMKNKPWRRHRWSQRQPSLRQWVAGEEIESPEHEIAVQNMNQWEVTQVSESKTFPEIIMHALQRVRQTVIAVLPDGYETKTIGSKCTIHSPLVDREQFHPLTSSFGLATEYHADYLWLFFLTNHL